MLICVVLFCMMHCVEDNLTVCEYSAWDIQVVCTVFCTIHRHFALFFEQKCKTKLWLTKVDKECKKCKLGKVCWVVMTYLMNSTNLNSSHHLWGNTVPSAPEQHIHSSCSNITSTVSVCWNVQTNKTPHGSTQSVCLDFAIKAYS